jgi:hypothetical protein
MVQGTNCLVGHGYILGLPVAAYLTWMARTDAGKQRHRSKVSDRTVARRLERRKRHSAQYGGRGSGSFVTIGTPHIVSGCGQIRTCTCEIVDLLIVILHLKGPNGNTSIGPCNPRTTSLLF